MKKTAILLLLVGSVWAFVLNARTQITKPDNLPVLGTPEQTAFLDLTKLTGSRVKPDVGVYQSHLTKLKMESFFRNFTWSVSEGWSRSVLRDGVFGYYFPYLMAGQFFSNQYNREQIFHSTGDYPGLYIWYEPEKNSYYLWGDYWNSPFVIGPFHGEPLSALTKAVIPTKGKRSFPDVNIEVISQHWTFPDEPEPVNTDKPGMGDSPYFRKLLVYEDLTSRLRIENNGKTNVYYLAREYGLDPVGVVLTRFNNQTDWNRRSFPFRNPAMGSGTKWIFLSPGMALEFEIKFRSDEGASYRFLMTLNDEPKYWDEVETLVPVPTMVRERKLDKNFKLLKKSK